MSVETLDEAYSAGWKISVRCAFGKGDGMKKVRECVSRDSLDMKTLVWTRGKDFPLARLESRMKCPRCGSRNVALVFDIPQKQNRMSA